MASTSWRCAASASGKMAKSTGRFRSCAALVTSSSAWSYWWVALSKSIACSSLSRTSCSAPSEFAFSCAAMLISSRSRAACSSASAAAAASRACRCSPSFPAKRSSWRSILPQTGQGLSGCNSARRASAASVAAARSNSHSRRASAALAARRGRASASFFSFADSVARSAKASARLSPALVSAACALARTVRAWLRMAIRPSRRVSASRLSPSCARRLSSGRAACAATSFSCAAAYSSSASACPFSASWR